MPETKAELAEKCTTIAKERDRFALLLSYIVRGRKPDATARYFYDGDTYKLQLYNVQGAHGGLVLTSRKEKGRAWDLFSVCLLDDLRAGRPYCAAESVCLEELAKARETILASFRGVA